MKTHIFDCKNCKTPTRHLTKRVCYKPHRGGHGGTKYTVEHCTKCNKRYYNGKLQKPHQQRQDKQNKHTKIG